MLPLPDVHEQAGIVYIESLTATYLCTYHQIGAQAASVTNLTTALEGIQDPDDSKEFNGDIIKKLHVAEKHIRKNKLKVKLCFTFHDND